MMGQSNSAAADRLLLVDDNLDNLRVLYQALEQEGYELLVAQTGEEALTTTKEAKPQLILLDINMPGIDGYETCRRLKSDSETEDSVVIFLSARGDVEDKVQGFELGAVDYIGKPFQFEEVVARVRKHLATYHQHKALEQENIELREQATGGFREFGGEHIEALIAEGESDRVEFKSTLRWNLYTNKPDKKIENACLKTVAAFLNSEGGILLVGVDDAGTAVGLEHDRFANEDKLLLHWNGLLKQHLGVESTQLVRSALRKVEQTAVLVAQCLPSPQPVFFSRDDDEVFFVRIGNGTQSLKPSQVLSYLDQRKLKREDPAGISSGSPQEIGAYSLDERIGTGGMGVVYRAHHAMLQRPAAVKLLQGDQITEQTIARFEREVQRTSQLNHPNTIAIYDYGRTPEGGFYYAMEYLDGITLEDLVEDYGPQPEGRVIHVLKQLCGALDEAHENALIHRDIKPANIMINHRGGQYDYVKLLDFGLVKALDARDETAVTQSGFVAGTPLYISPEGLTNPQEVGARSDLYSVGAVGYFMLSGKPVFEGNSVVDVCLQLTSNPPTRPSEKLGSPVSADFESLILNCLEKNPEDRPATAKELLTELSQCSQATSWTQEQAASWWSNR
jgi:CheY-like chemotaxis protein